jgi:hypothetical protein
MAELANMLFFNLGVCNSNLGIEKIMAFQIRILKEINLWNVVS